MAAVIQHYIFKLLLLNTEIETRFNDLARFKSRFTHLCKCLGNLENKKFKFKERYEVQQFVVYPFYSYNRRRILAATFQFENHGETYLISGQMSYDRLVDAGFTDY